MDFILKHKGAVVGVVLLVIAGAWWGFAGSSKDPAVLQTEGAAAKTSVDRDVVQALIALRAITLSDAIFKDPAFATLRDFGIQIVAEPIGRRDPFAPLSGGSSGGSAAGASLFQKK